MSFSMPTVISTAVILNSVIRGAELAAKELGSDYFAVLQKEIGSSHMRVYRSISRGSALSSDSSQPLSTVDRLNTSQSVPRVDDPLWTIKIDDYGLRNAPKKLNSLFSEIPPRYFFLTEGAALGYILSIEKATMDSVLRTVEALEILNPKAVDSEDSEEPS